jgi:hypothetical protein
VFVYVNGLDWFGVMVFTASFNDILVISYWSVLLVEETGGVFSQQSFKSK